MYSNLIKRFREDQSGTATIESLLWMPLFFFLFILIIDVSMVFYGKSEVLRFVQNENRTLSVWVGTEPDWEAEEAAAEVRLRGRIVGLMRNASPSELAGVTVDIEKDGNNIINTTVSLPGRPMMAVGSLPNFSATRITVRAQHYKEVTL
jgi:hypothetical protein